MIHVLRIEKWRPTTLNEFIGRHPMVGHRLKKADRKVVAGYAKQQQIPPAEGRRRVSIKVVLGKRRRECDPDSMWKSLNDALVNAGLLTTDTVAGVELGPVSFDRDPAGLGWTEITLTDVEPAPPIEVLDKGPKRTRRKAVGK